MDVKSLLFKVPDMTEQEHLNFYGLLLSIIEELGTQAKNEYLASAFSVVDPSQLTTTNKETFYDFVITPPSFEDMVKKVGILSQEKRLFVYSRIYAVISTGALNEKKELVLSKVRTHLAVSREDDIKIRKELSEVRNKISPLREGIKGAAKGVAVGGGVVGTVSVGIASNALLFAGPPGWILRGLIGIIGIIGYILGLRHGKRKAEETKKEIERRAQEVIRRLQETINHLTERMGELEKRLHEAKWYKEQHERIKQRINELLATKHIVEQAADLLIKGEEG